MVSRRSFLKLLAAAPAVVALPAIAKQSDPLGGRRYFVGETLHLYEPLILDERMSGLHMERCHVYFHHDRGGVISGNGQNIYVCWNIFERAA